MAIMVVVFCAQRQARRQARFVGCRDRKNPASGSRAAQRRTLEILLALTTRALPTKEEVMAAIWTERCKKWLRKGH